jgi:hypothetical protein
VINSFEVEPPVRSPRDCGTDLRDVDFANVHVSEIRATMLFGDLEITQFSPTGKNRLIKPLCLTDS